MTFDYFYYDVHQPENAPDDPRRILTPSIDELLSEVCTSPAGHCSAGKLCGRYGADALNRLERIGLIRIAGGAAWLESVVIVPQDFPVLAHCFDEDVQAMSDAIFTRWDEFRHIVSCIGNGDAKTHLYHLLCGAVMDGAMFDLLDARGLLTTSRPHPSGRDYLIIAYAQDEALSSLSEQLLCSYNRLTDGRRALQSFGDAKGLRCDAYRFARMYASGHVPDSMAHIVPLWERLPVENRIQALLDEAESLACTGHCSDDALALLCAFGYAERGRLCVPVYTRAHQPALKKLTSLAQEVLLPHLTRALSRPVNVTCAAHGVAQGEITNELYHVLFGKLNEELVRRKLVTAPEALPDQGRFLRSVQLF